MAVGAGKPESDTYPAQVVLELSVVTYILPGYSPRNKDWAEEVAKNLKVEGQVRPVFWEHWTDPEYKFRPKEKADLLARHAKGESINIVAKSIGTLVASYIIDLVPNKINKAIFCGIPVNDIGTKDTDFIKAQIKNLGDKIVIYQNENDPHGAFGQVKDFGKVYLKAGSDHDYPYYEEFDSYLTS